MKKKLSVVPIGIAELRKRETSDGGEFQMNLKLQPSCSSTQQTSQLSHCLTRFATTPNTFRNTKIFDHRLERPAWPMASIGMLPF